MNFTTLPPSNSHQPGIRRLAWLSLIVLTWLFTSSVQATQVTNTTQSALASALAGGGTVTFTVDGTINLSQTMVIATNVILDGTGHNVAISGLVLDGGDGAGVNPGVATIERTRPARLQHDASGLHGVPRSTASM